MTNRFLLLRKSFPNLRSLTLRVSILLLLRKSLSRRRNQSQEKYCCPTLIASRTLHLTATFLRSLTLRVSILLLLRKSLSRRRNQSQEKYCFPTLIASRTLYQTAIVTLNQIKNPLFSIFMVFGPPKSILFKIEIKI